MTDDYTGPAQITWLTTSQVAMLLGVSRYTVARWARAGKIPSVKLPSGMRRYDKDAILRVLPKT